MDQNKSTLHDTRIAIVGGGLAGSLLALALAKRGHGVDVYEARPDPRSDTKAGGRSINLGLSKRGINALTEVGLIEEVMKLTIVMRGRVIHGPDGSTRFQPYGKNRGEVLHSIDRNELNRLLLERAQEHPKVKLHFQHKLVRIDKQRRELEFAVGNEAADQTVKCQPAWVIGADGAFSNSVQPGQAVPARGFALRHPSSRKSESASSRFRAPKIREAGGGTGIQTRLTDF